MNAFYEHHKNNNQFTYRCFDRLLLEDRFQKWNAPILDAPTGRRDAIRGTALKVATPDKAPFVHMRRSRRAS